MASNSWNLNNRPVEYSLSSILTEELITITGIIAKYIRTDLVNTSSIFSEFTHLKANNADIFDIKLMPENSEGFNNANDILSKFGIMSADSINFLVHRNELLIPYVNGEFTNCVGDLVILETGKVFEVTDLETEVPGLNNMFTYQNEKNTYMLKCKAYNYNHDEIDVSDLSFGNLDEMFGESLKIEEKTEQILSNTKQMLIDPVFGDIISGGDEVYSNKIPGMIMSFGLNDYGQLGNGNDNFIIPTPSISSDLNAWYKIAASNGSSVGSTFAIKTDGTLWVSGYNNDYQFGTGTNTNSNVFVKVSNANDWSLVSSGLKHTAAIKDNGTLWTWGDNQYGQLGDNSAISKSSPIQIGSLTDWSGVACGSNFTICIKTDGTLWSFGYNILGQLGDNTIVNKSSPIQIGSLTNWKNVACGDNHTILTKTDGTLWSFGYNNGQLGDDSIINRSSPVQIGILANWKDISCGSNHTAAIKDNGTLWTWGYNDKGQLGDNTLVSKSSPVQISALTDWKDISCGNRYTIVIK